MRDNSSILLKFENGSNAVVNYFSNGSKKYSKERLEVYSQNKTWILDDYVKTYSFSSKSSKIFTSKKDKGHKNILQKYINNIKSSDKPIIPLDEIINVSKAAIYSVKSFQEKNWIDLN